MVNKRKWASLQKIKNKKQEQKENGPHPLEQ